MDIAFGTKALKRVRVVRVRGEGVDAAYAAEDMVMGLG